MTQPHSAAPQPPSPWISALCVFALLWAQGLGLVHKTVHTVPAGVALAGVTAPHGGPHEAGGLDALLGHADHSVQCRLFDQLAAGDAVAPAMVAFVPVRVPCVAALGAIALPAGQARHFYRARAPPTIA